MAAGEELAWFLMATRARSPLQCLESLGARGAEPRLQAPTFDSTLEPQQRWSRSNTQQGTQWASLLCWSDLSVLSHLLVMSHLRSSTGQKWLRAPMTNVRIEPVIGDIFIRHRHTACLHPRGELELDDQVYKEEVEKLWYQAAAVWPTGQPLTVQ